MIEYIEGNIFNSPAQVIVNAVNTVGVMGKGIALEYKKRYPEMFDAYKEACDKKLLETGKLMLYYAPDHWILLFPTKKHWRSPSKLEYIESGLDKFVHTYAEKGITSIAFPRLGCGNGELEWDDVRPLMEKYLKPLPIDVYIYIGMGKDITPEHKIQRETTKWLRAHAKDMSFSGMVDDLTNQSSLFPMEFHFCDDIASATMKDGNLTIVYQNVNYQLHNDELFRIWDEIRHQEIFLEGDSFEKDLFCGLLFELGYLSRIRVKRSGSEALLNGYQLNKGLGRIYGWDAK